MKITVNTPHVTSSDKGNVITIKHRREREKIGNSLTNFKIVKTDGKVS